MKNSNKKNKSIENKPLENKSMNSSYTSEIKNLLSKEISQLKIPNNIHFLKEKKLIFFYNPSEEVQSKTIHHHETISEESDNDEKNLKVSRTNSLITSIDHPDEYVIKNIIKSEITFENNSIFKKCLPKDLLNTSFSKKSELKSSSERRKEGRRRRNSISICQNQSDFKEIFKNEDYDNLNDLYNIKEENSNYKDEYNFCNNDELDNKKCNHYASNANCFVENKNRVATEDYESYNSFIYHQNNDGSFTYYNDYMRMENSQKNQNKMSKHINISHRINPTQQAQRTEIKKNTNKIIEENIKYSKPQLTNDCDYIFQKSDMEIQEYFIKIKNELIVDNDYKKYIPVIIKYMNQTAKNAHGNYFLQKIISLCNNNELTLIGNEINSNLNDFIYNSYASRVIQKYIEVSNSSSFSIIKNKILNNLMFLIKDHNGIHIIYKIILKNNTDSKFIYDFIYINFLDIALNQNGCCLLQKVLSINNNTQFKKFIFDLIIGNIFNLILSSQGIYLFYYIIKNSPSAVIKSLICILFNHFTFKRIVNSDNACKIIEKLVNEKNMIIIENIVNLLFYNHTVNLDVIQSEHSFGFYYKIHYLVNDEMRVKLNSSLAMCMINLPFIKQHKNFIVISKAFPSIFNYYIMHSDYLSSLNKKTYQVKGQSQNINGSTKSNNSLNIYQGYPVGNNNFSLYFINNNYTCGDKCNKNKI